MYELNGDEYSLEELQGAAKKYGMEFDPYLETMKKKGLVEKTNDAAVDANVASTDTDLASESISSALPETSPGSGVTAVEGVNPMSPKGLVQNKLKEIRSSGIGGQVVDAIFRFGEQGAGAVDRLIESFETGKTGLKGDIFLDAMPFGFLANLDGKSYKTRYAAYENYMIDQSQKTKKSKQQIDADAPTNVVKLEGVLDFFRQSLPDPPTDENGNPVDYLDLFQKGDISGGINAFTDDIAGALPSVLISRLPYGTGAAVLGLGTYGDEYGNELYERAKMPGFDIEKERDNIRNNAMITGSADAVAEFFGGRMLNKLAGGKLSKTTVKEILTQAPKVFMKKMGVGFATEFAEEGSVGVVSELADAWTFDEGYKPLSNYIRTFFKDGLVGGFMGGGTTSVSNLSLLDKNKIYEYVSPEDHKAKQLKLESSIYKLTKDRQQAKGKDKDFFDAQIKELKKQKEENSKNIYEFFDGLTKKEKAEYAENIDLKHKQLDIIGNDDYSEETQEIAKNNLKKYTEANNKFFDGAKVGYDAKLEADVGRILKNSERLREAGSSFGFNKKLLNVVTLDTDAKVKEVSDKHKGFDSADGMFYAKDESGKPTIYINSRVAAATGATNVIGHEYLHAIVSRSFGDIGATNLKSSVKSFVDYLNATGNENVVNTIEKRLAKNYDALDSDGNIIRDENGLVKTKELKDQEEYFNIFSDVIKTQKVKAVEEKSSGIKNSFRATLRGLGFGEVDFQSGQEVFDFLVDYNTNMKKEGLFGKLASRGIAKVSLKGLEAKADAKTGKSDALVDESGQFSSTVNLDKGDGDVSQRIDAYTEGAKTKAEFQSGAFGNVYQGIIDGKFDRVLGEGLSSEQREIMREELADRLINYDPAKTPNLSKWMYGGKGKGGNIGFSALVAKKKLFEKGERRKSEVEGDAPSGTGQTVLEKAAETVTVKDAEIELDAEQEYSQFRQDLGLDDAMMQKVRDAVIKTFGTKLPEVSSKKFRAALEKAYRTELKKPIQDMIGSRNAFNEFLGKDYKTVFGKLPVETLIQMERNVDPEQRIFTTSRRITKPTEVDELVAKGKLPKDVNRLSGPLLITKLPYPGIKKVMAFYRGENMSEVLGYKVGASTLGTRKDKLAMEMGVELGFDATMETVQAPEIISKRSEILELTGQEQAVNEISIMAKQIDRNPNIKFSKTGVEFIENAMVLVNAVSKDGLMSVYDIDKNGSYTLTNKYKNIDDFTSDFVFESLVLKDVIYNKIDEPFAKILQKVVSGTRGKIYEQYIINRFKNVPGIELLQETQTEEGDLPDVYAKLFGQIFNVEVKMGNFQAGSVTMNGLDINTGEMTINKEFTFNDKIKKTGKKTLPGWKKLQKRAKELGVDMNKANDPMPVEVYDQLRDEGFLKGITKHDVFTEEMVAEIYNNKEFPTYYIQIQGKGLYYLGENPLNLNVPKLEGDVIFKWRPVRGSKTKKGNVRIIYRGFPTFTDIKENSTVDLGTDKGMRDFMNDKSVQAMKFSKSLLKPNIEQNSKLSSAVQFSRTVNESRGITVLDFDDTLATTKSGIRYTMPNPSGKPQPGRKAILIAGNAGAGKTTVINQLGLRKQGFKYINQDIALDWLTKNNGLPQDMNEFTREQADKWRELGGEAAVAAKNKASRLQGKGDGVVIDGTGAVGVQFQSMARDFKDAGYDVQVVFIESSLETAIERNSKRSERRLTDVTVRNSVVDAQKNKKAFKEMVTFFPYSAKGFVEINTDNLKQGDPLPANLVETMDNFTKGYIKGRMNAEEFASKGAELLEQGAEYDFSEFNKVVEGKTAPLFNKAMKLQGKFGPKNMFVLTARPAESQSAIFNFLKANGLNIPLENITGLGNSTAEAKAFWMANKVGEGYNDFYFADDALQNVQAVKEVLEQLDVKSKVQQAKVKFSKTMDRDFNSMLERTRGIGAEKVFSRIAAEKRGKNVGKFQFFVPPSADDFAGLLRYFAGRGKQGDADIAFFKKALLDPFARADREMSMARQTILNDYKALRKKFPDVKKRLGKLMPNSDFTLDNAIRVYLWNKAGFEIPGLSKRDIEDLVARVEVDPITKAFADSLGAISKQQEGYIKPGENWSVETIAYDLQNITSKIGRKKYLEEFIENKNIIFTKENLNKIEAAYGSNFREALEDALYRMESGTNRSRGMGRIEGKWNNWVNNSVGAIMFFNARSAVLQTLSTVNFINFENNNVFAAAKAFANQKQYWSDFSMLFNSDFLRNRRAGLATNVNEAELASAVAGAQNKAKAALQYLLKIGFTPTQIADSFAIASGGSTYYRNQVNFYLKDGMDQKAAEEQAFLDFQEIAEETQQSARPDRISQQQASSLGRIVLAFANTPMQYNRLIKKAAGDLINKRGDWRSHVSRIIYYGAAQNFIFSALQSAIFALAFDDEDDEEQLDKKTDRLLNGMLDSLLRGSGLAGAVVSTIKNTALRFIAEDKKGFRADYGNVIVDAVNLSPPIGSKIRKLYSATKTYKFNKEEIMEGDKLDLENPLWDAVGNVVSATTNVPLDRAFRKIDNMKESLNSDNENWQRIAVGLGWDQWSLGIKKPGKSKRKSSRGSSRGGSGRGGSGRGN